MKKVLLIVGGVLLALVVIGLPLLLGIRPFIGPKARPLTDRRFESSPARIERGKYLVTSGRAPCLLCHSPMETAGGGLRVPPGKELTGRSFAPDGLPFATAMNLTPDPETGIGKLSDDQLARAIREGISHDGRTLFPVMPYTNFIAMTDEDLASIVVYLRSVPPVRNALTPSAIPFPLNRILNGLPAPIEAPVSADLSTPEKRGAYIARLAVCGECHTPRDDRGNQPEHMEFSGGTPMVFEGHPTRFSANITPGVNGIPYYTEDLFIEVMRTGRMKAREIDPMMPTAYYRNMTDADLKDLFAYLKSLAPVDHYVDNTQAPTKCERCKLTHGGGERNKPLT